jgi:predicted dehydrogenase
LETPEDAPANADAGIIPMHGRAPSGRQRYGDTPSDHLRLARIFLEERLPVFVDKPFATDLNDAETMIRLAIDHDTPLMSCSCMRYAPQVRELARKTKRGDLGKLRIVHSLIHSPLKVNFVYYGIHAVEAGHLVMHSQARSISSLMSKALGSRACSYVTTVNYAKGEILIIQVLEKVRPGRYSVQAFGDRGTEEAHLDERFSIIPYGSEIPVEYARRDLAKVGLSTLRFPLSERRDEEDYFRIMLTEYLGMVRTRKPPIPYAEILTITKLLLTAKRSLDSGTTQYL